MYRVANLYARNYGALNSIRKFSTEAPQKPQEAVSQWTKLKNFVSNNRQAIVNCIGAYFVLSYSIHNFRVQQAWDDRERQFKDLEKENNRIKTGLMEKAWAAEVEARILDAQPKGWGSKGSVPEKGSTLVSAISDLIQYAPPTSEDIVKSHMSSQECGKDNKDTEGGETTALSAIFAAGPAAISTNFSSKSNSDGPKMV